MSEAVEGDTPAEPAAAGDSPAGVAQRLLAAATEEFVRQGYQGASIARIVEAAGCNVRMVYHYFGNKLGLYRVCIETAYDRLRQHEAEAAFWELPPAEAIGAFVRFTFDYMVDTPEFQGLMRIENMAAAQLVQDLEGINTRARDLFAALERVLERGLAEGVFARRPDPGLLYMSILGLCTVHVSNRHTMGAVLGRDLSDPAFLAARRAEVEGIILASLAAPA